MTYRVVITDDEPLARQRLRRLIEELDDYRVVGEAGDGRILLEQMPDWQPDIVLLDIRMPGTDGMEAAAQLSQMHNPPAIIFCTAYDQYAIEAFRHAAADYLLKPVRRDALKDALARAGRINRVQLGQLRQAKPTPQLTIRSQRGTELIDLARVRYCQAEQKYVTLVHDQGESLTDLSLKELEERYPDDLLRIHRNTLVGTRYLTGLQRKPDGQTFAVLRDSDVELPVSRRHISQVKGWLEGASEV
ncbi:LytTR family DNA-binding domain-containing protein [Marinobacteraceae bacterium S3BR75-40.1]